MSESNQPTDFQKWQEEMDRWKGEIDIWKTHRSIDTAVYNVVNAAGQSALKSAMLINGGAAVAILAFIGTLINNPNYEALLQELLYSMLLFVAGVTVVAIACGATYIAVYCDGKSNSDEQKKGVAKWGFLVFNFSAWLLTIAGYASFVWGSLNAYFSFQSLFEIK